ncbi:MAG: CRISPR-associated endonuclease Cas2 [Oscillospiraceae bacterium]|nr:CRISPR-associated endonuclease Cas2 [Oscillospiraceae bacterium]
MMIIVAYDVDFTDPKGAKRLRKVAKLCEQYGVRVQNSVFEIMMDTSQLVCFKARLSEIIDKKSDSVRFYRLGNKWESKIDFLGVQKGFSQDQPLIL